MNIAIIHPLKEPINATLSLPGSKSLTNRALVIAALTPRQVTILHPLVADDTSTMASCLTNLGIPIEQKKNRWIIHGDRRQTKNLKHQLNARLSGTTLRFIIPLACITPGTTFIRGEDGLNARPIGILVNTLRARGASIEYLGKNGHSPLQIQTSVLRSGTIRMRGDVSSQFISALLMTLPVIGESTLIITGPSVSQAFIRMTIALMETCGVTVQKRGTIYTIPRGVYTASRIVIEPDASSACYIAAIAALTHSTITIRSINAHSVQPDMRFFTILRKMGNRISYTADGVTIHGAGVRPVSVDMSDCPDQIQTLAVLAAFAKGKTVIRGIQTLRMKETDRVRALESELRRMHISTRVTKSTISILGGSPHAGCIKTYGDHRMAMAFAVAGSTLPGIQIEEPTVVTKTFPGFWDILSTLGIVVRKEHI